MQLQKTITDLSSSQAKSSASKQSEVYEKLMKEIHEKNQKIEILKEMVRSSQGKQKDVKKEGLSPDTSMQEILSDKAQKSPHDLMNSLAAKTINKFFAIYSFHRNSPQDSPPDLQRLIKKLRQDLKSYSVFSVKDLQASVPQLGYALNETKPHINLDELIGIINKAVNL